MKKIIFLAFLMSTALAENTIPSCRQELSWRVLRSCGESAKQVRALAKQPGLLILEVGECDGQVAIRLKKEVDSYIAYFFSADGAKISELTNGEETVYAHWEPSETGGVLAFNDGRRNRFRAQIARDSITILQGSELDNLKMVTPLRVCIAGETRFHKLTLQSPNISFSGSVSVDHLNASGETFWVSQFLNEGTLRAEQCSLQFTQIRNAGLITAQKVQVGVHASFVNTGTFFLSEQLIYEGSGLLHNQGTLLSKAFSLKCSGGLLNEGEFFSTDPLVLDNVQIVFRNAEKGRIASKTKIEILSGGSNFYNQGTLETPSLVVDKFAFLVGIHGVVSVDTADIRTQTAYNQGQILTQQLDAQTAHLGGAGTVKLTNGAIRISNAHQNGGEIICGSECTLTAPSEHNFGVLAAPNGKGTFTAQATQGDFVNAKDIQCGSGRTCNFIAEGDIRNTPSSQIKADGAVVQTAGRNVENEGRIFSSPAPTP